MKIILSRLEDRDVDFNSKFVWVNLLVNFTLTFRRKIKNLKLFKKFTNHKSASLDNVRIKLN